MWRATLRGLLAKKARLAMTTLAIVLGVGFMAGTYVLTDTMNKAFDDVFAATAELSDVVVRGKSAFEPDFAGGGSGATEERDPVPETLLSLVRGVPGVARAGGDVSGYAQVVDPETGEAVGGAGPPTIGVSWSGDTSVLELRSGRGPSGPEEVAIDAATARRQGIAVGERVTILFQGPPGEFSVVGTVGFGDADNLAGATLALFDVATAQRVLGREGEFDSISVIAEEGVSATELRGRIATALPEGFEALTSATVADEQANALKEGLGFFRTGLLVFAFVALFVGAFIIFNTFSIIVAQRTRELGLLRVLGATSRQVLASVIGEALLVGLVAAAIGVGFGVLIALGLQAVLGVFGVDLPSTATQLLPRTVAVSMAVGALVTFAAAIVPARKAARVAPLQALRDEAPAAGGSLRRRVAVGLAVTALGVAGLLGGLFGGVPNAAATVGLGAAVIFLGVALLSPFVARPLARVLGAPLVRLGMSGRLGRGNAMRNPRRTAATAAALMIGLGLVSFVAVFAASLRASADVALDRILRADFILSTSTFMPFSTQVAADLGERPELAVVSPLRQQQFRVEGENHFVAGVDPGTIAQVAEVEMVSGRLEALTEDGILVNRDLAETNGWRVGDTVRVTFARTGPQELEIAGTYEDNQLLNNFVVSLPLYAANFREQLDSVVFIDAAGGVPLDEARGAVDEVLAAYPNVEVSDQAEFKERQAGFIDQLLALVSALLGLAIVIALFGIVNTLGLSIFERTRELGLLRAVGMTRRQVRAMIRWESVIIAVLGAVLGVAVGVFFGWAMRQALADEGISEFVVPVGQLGLYVALAGVAGVLAAVGPARRAARLDVLAAIAYE